MKSRQFHCIGVDSFKGHCNIGIKKAPNQDHITYKMTDQKHRLRGISLILPSSIWQRKVIEKGHNVSQFHRKPNQRNGNPWVKKSCLKNYTIFCGKVKWKLDFETGRGQKCQYKYGHLMELKQRGYGMCVPLTISLFYKCDHHAQRSTHAHEQNGRELYKTRNFIKRLLLHRDQ